MSTDLYAVLGLSSRDATPEQIRKAYRKKALQTHPDRLGPDATASDKASAEEQFRLVNNAYEVLSNEENRKLYDRHGVWPPPQVQEEPSYRSHRYEPYDGRPHRRETFDSFERHFNNPFFNDDGFGSFGFGGGRHRRSPFEFTDPFELFRDIFRNDPFFSSAIRDDPFLSRSPLFSDLFGGPARPSPFGRSPFGGFGGGGSMFPEMLLGGSMFPEMQMLTGPGGGGGRSFHSSSRTIMGRSGGGVSESIMTRTVNGVTETIHKRVDAEGNEHVTLTYPDGRKKYTLNGVEQPSTGALPSPSRPERGIAPPPLPQQQVPPAIQAPSPPPAPPSRHSRERDPHRRHSSRGTPYAPPEQAYPPPPPTSTPYAPPPPPPQQPYTPAHSYQVPYQQPYMQAPPPAPAPGYAQPQPHPDPHGTTRRMSTGDPLTMYPPAQNIAAGTATSTPSPTAAAAAAEPSGGARGEHHHHHHHSDKLHRAEEHEHAKHGLGKLLSPVVSYFKSHFAPSTSKTKRVEVAH
ncbi:DnaJ-domain-containing protein [Punctularia strigosozonata HHB-11173 SS5]|uniref:DnaJ-domain-containing protein n=1 Tax=Punctularia strigosozonata (strain HHB-11173) TaxID=741275 RepID=R7S0A4_PUNST|nr:DnaJ-domain-containing protein [Punctularia strigosozonata HHB-11173 SS5]EIN03810.1 DnaJ-domain-containing protein [Punctularia strigosozonata HHB-11173 SS5]